MAKFGFCPKLDEHDGLTFGPKPEMCLDQACSAPITETRGSDRLSHFVEGRALAMRGLGAEGSALAPALCFTEPHQWWSSLASVFPTQELVKGAGVAEGPSARCGSRRLQGRLSAQNQSCSDLRLACCGAAGHKEPFLSQSGRCLGRCVCVAFQ